MMLEAVELSYMERIRLLARRKLEHNRRKMEIYGSYDIDDHGFMDINFIGGFGSFTHYPYYYFHKDGRISATNKSLENKIVLVVPDRDAIHTF